MTMKKFKNYRFFAGLLIGVLTLYGVNTTPVQGDSTKDVVVVNTNANPVPVSGTVTGTVTGSVSITGTPTVNLATSPVLVRDVDNPGRHAFQAEPDFCTSAETTCFVFFTVPANQLLVIETVSIQSQVPPGQHVTASLTITSNTSASYRLPMELQGTFPSGTLITPADILSGLLPVRLYAKPGSTVNVGALRNSSTGSFLIQASFSGGLSRFLLNLAECGGSASYSPFTAARGIPT